MDEARDLQRADIYSRLFDAQRIRINPFHKNRSANRLYGRVERVAAALYLLTRHIPESEPLKNAVRSSAIALLDKSLQLRDTFRTVESETMGSFESLIRKLISLVRMLAVAGELSLQNADTITGALDELSSFINSAQRSDLSESITISREDLMGDTSPLYVSDSIKDIKDARKSVRDKGQSSSTNAAPSGARREGVVAILRASGTIGIKEISEQLPDYSQKMIQREIAALVKSGQVKKVGFKRWSKYVLVG